MFFNTNFDDDRRFERADCSFDSVDRSFEGYEAHLRVPTRPVLEREFFIDNLLVRIHFIIVMIRWTGLAPWGFELPFPGSLTSTFLGPV